METFTTHITDLSHDNRGISHIDGKTTFIEGALPGETVTFHYQKKRGKFDEAELVDVLEASPDRTTPRCQHFGVCGGCQLQHLSSEAQIHHKQKQLATQLQHFGKIEPLQWLDPITGNAWGYRRKARLGVRYVDKKNTALVGFRERKTNYLAVLEECLVLDPRVGLLIKPLRELIASLDNYRSIAQIEVAIGDIETALIFRHLEPLTDEDQAKLITFAQQHNILLYLQPGKPKSVHKVYPDTQNEYLHYQLPAQQLTFQFHPLDFTQINAEINQKMVTQALNLLELDSNDVVLDLFCGLGNFSLPLAQKSMHVTGVEGDETMVQRAEENATFNQIKNTDFHCANLFELTGAEDWLNKSYTKILLDPPRTGAENLLPHIAKLQAKTILYISCNPATLARDAGQLVHQYGYQMTHAGIMDMFPHTGHVESMALFIKI